jgi:predicted acyltransferase
VFRGFAILGMLLVNNVALDRATPVPLTHAPWNGGVRFADMVFPWFLFIVGVAIPWSWASFKNRGLPAWRYDLRVLGRAAVLVLLGCLIHSSLAKRPVFEMGVLQIIGMAYCVAALLVELPLRRRLLLAGGLLLAHWALIRFLKVPGMAAGEFTEGRNVIQHFNQLYLQRYGLKGLISLIPTSALVLLGAAAGDVLRGPDKPLRNAARLMLGGLAVAAAGWLWNLDLPFNKPVWTASYILYTGGLGGVLLGLLYLVVDVAGWRAWAFPLVVFGTNALAAYVAPILVKLHVLLEWTWKMPDGSRLPLQQAMLHALTVHLGRTAGGWAYTLAYVAVWWLVLLALYRRRVFLRV